MTYHGKVLLLTESFSPVAAKKTLLSFFRAQLVVQPSATLCFPSVSAAFHLQLSDCRQAREVSGCRQHGRLWPQQGWVHGEGAAEQRGVPARGLSGRRPLVQRGSAGRPAKLHPVQQSVGCFSQTWGTPGSSWRCWKSLWTQSQVAKSKSASKANIRRACAARSCVR